VVEELEWVIACAEEHLGVERAGRYLRKFYPWYVERLGASREVADALQRTATVAQARALLEGAGDLAAAA
jgi:hypothetical protein